MSDVHRRQDQFASGSAGATIEKAEDARADIRATEGSAYVVSRR